MASYKYGRGARLTFSVTNKIGMIRNIYRAVHNVDKELERALKRNGKKIQATAKALCPWRTGFMSRHIRLSFSNQGRTFEVGWYRKEFMIPKTRFRFYPPWVELGSQGRTPSLTIYRAMLTHEQDLKRDMRKAIRRGIDKSKRST